MKRTKSLDFRISSADKEIIQKVQGGVVKRLNRYDSEESTVDQLSRLKLFKVIIKNQQKLKLKKFLTIKTLNPQTTADGEPSKLSKLYAIADDAGKKLNNLDRDDDQRIAVQTISKGFEAHLQASREIDSLIHNRNRKGDTELNFTDRGSRVTNKREGRTRESSKSREMARLNHDLASLAEDSILAGSVKGMFGTKVRHSTMLKISQSLYSAAHDFQQKRKEESEYLDNLASLAYNN